MGETSNQSISESKEIEIDVGLDGVNETGASPSTNSLLRERKDTLQLPGGAFGDNRDILALSTSDSNESNMSDSQGGSVGKDALMLDESASTSISIDSFLDDDHLEYGLQKHLPLWTAVRGQLRKYQKKYTNGWAMQL